MGRRKVRSIGRIAGSPSQSILGRLFRLMARAWWRVERLGAHLRAMGGFCRGLRVFNWGAKRTQQQTGGVMRVAVTLPVAVVVFSCLSLSPIGWDGQKRRRCKVTFVWGGRIHVVTKLDHPVSEGTPGGLVC
jgi:hypothetical protein